MRTKGPVSPAGVLVRRTRHALGISQVDLARTVGCNQSLIAHLECGYTPGLGPRYIEKVAKALNLPVKHLRTPGRS